MQRTLALLLSLVAAAGFAAAFAFPFVHSDFDPDLPSPVMGAVDAVQRGTGWLGDRARDLLGEELGGQVTGWTSGVTGGLVDGSLDAVLGPVGPGPDGELRSWAECMGSGGDTWSGCVKDWIAYKAGIPVGDQYILGVIWGLAGSGEVLLALLLFVFSVCFPVSKVAMSAYLALVGPASQPRALKALKLTSKWSMTDVFVVALLITFFKADSFNFHFQARLGVYCFAGAAILSSMAVYLLEGAGGSGERRDRARTGV